MKPIFSLVLFQWRLQKCSWIIPDILLWNGWLSSAPLVRKFLYLPLCLYFLWNFFRWRFQKLFFGKHLKKNIIANNLKKMCSNCEKVFISSAALVFPLRFLICYYPWSLDLIKWTRNKLNKQDNEDSDTQVSSLFFLVVFWCWFYFF